jgi:hypothetical protein
MSVRCVMPFCNRRAPGEADDESLCSKHWKECAGPIRTRYECAWEEMTRADRLGAEDIEAAQRVTAAWRELVTHALRVSA